MKQLRLRRPDECRVCTCSLAAGTVAWWDRRARRVTCLDCQPAAVTAANSLGDDAARAGASAQAEYERWRRNRQRRAPNTSQRRSTEPQHQRAWAKGAEGERVVGAALAGLKGDGVLVLHDRRVPSSRANIDHLVIAPSGVFVVDAKHWSGRVERRRGRGDGAEARLFVAGRDRTSQLDKLLWQMDVVFKTLAAAGHPIEVGGYLALVGADFPLLQRRPYGFGHAEVGTVRMITRRLAANGPLTVADRMQRLRALHSALPAA